MTGHSAEPLRLVGRDGELATIEAALDGLPDGPRLIAVSGEAGIGKTALLAELCRLADERGMLALRGAAAQYEPGLPFGAVVEALDDYAQAIPDAQLESLGHSQLAELAQVLPSLERLQPGRPTGAQDERYRSHLAVRALLELLAEGRPVVLALDDLHWADEATIELVSNLVRRPPRAPVALVLSHRTGQLPDRLAAALETGAQDPPPVGISLGPLDEDAARALLGERADTAARAELLRLSGGNPFYLEELSRAGTPASEGAEDRPWIAASGDPSGAAVPAPIAAALARELGALPAEVREVAQGAAVAGHVFTPELASEAAGAASEPTLAALDALLERDLIRPTQVPRRFRFRHPIVHGAVYEATSPGWRLAAHGRVAEALRRREAPALERAPHVEASAVPGDAAAVALLTEAGNSAALRAPAVAAHWFGAALRLLPDGDREAKLGLMVAQAQALGYAGRLEQARKVLDEVMIELGPDEHAIRGRVAAGAARIDQLLGRHAEALELLSSALAGIPDQAGPEATELKVQLAGACFFNGDFEGLRDWVGQALAEATERGDKATRAAATGSLGAAEYMTGDADAARARLDEAERLLGDLDDQAVAARLHSLVWHGMTEVYLERFDRAEAVFARGIAVARSTGHGHVTTLNRIGQGQLRLWRGRLDEARELLDSAAEAAMLTGNDQFLSWALWGGCRAAILSGDVPEAVRLGERSVDAGGEEPDPVSALAGCYLAEARLEAGEPPAACRELLIRSVGGEEIPLVERGFRAHVQELLTRIELAAGDPDRAAHWAGRAEESAQGMEIAGRDAEARRATAAVALAREEHEAAAGAAREAVELFDGVGLPIDAARARILLGRALAPEDRGAAIEQLRSARDSLESVGAARYRDQAAQELRRLGERVARPKRGRAQMGSGVASLSGREEEVAGLVAEGRTNKQIAAELFLSEKTIEKHLARIFDKLEVTGRAQVAAAIEREREPAGR